MSIPTIIPVPPHAAPLTRKERSESARRAVLAILAPSVDEKTIQRARSVAESHGYELRRVSDFEFMMAPRLGSFEVTAGFSPREV